MKKKILIPNLKRHCNFYIYLYRLECIYSINRDSYLIIVSCRRYTDEENICTVESEYDIKNTPPIFLSEIFLTIKIWNIVFKQKQTDMEDKKMFKILKICSCIYATLCVQMYWRSMRIYKGDHTSPVGNEHIPCRRFARIRQSKLIS
jgi:hypothetical protein